MADNMIMEFDDVIRVDSQDYIVLPEGDYNFTVKEFTRGDFPGGKQIPHCKKVTLTLQVETDKGIAFVNTDLILYRLVEWKLSDFFRCIGQKKVGEELVMNWPSVINSKGRAHFKPRSYEKNGVEKQANDVEKFLPWDEKYFSSEPAEMQELDDDDGGFPF